MSAALEVNECRVFATVTGSAWWVMFRQRFRNTERITVLTSTLGGDVVSVACQDIEHAEWLRDTGVANGIPRTAFKVRKPVAS